ncbi:MAG: serine hydrolase domain-containing protein [Rhodospirillales bacterium]
MYFLRRKKAGRPPAAAAVLLLALAVFPVLRAAAQSETLLPPAKQHEVRAAISEEMERLRIPGLSAAIALKLRMAWSEGFGQADIENSVPARAHTVYRLASISKPITAVAVMQLAERGKLKLDEAIQTYVPAFPQKEWPVTVRDLLAHLGGVRHYRSQAEVQSTQHYTEVLGALDVFGNDPLLFKPGTRYSYTTYGYTLLGGAVESASGMRFMEYLREHIFGPARMDSICDDNVYAIVPHRARGYRRARDGEIENCALADTSNKIPGGGMISTAGDLVRFASAVAGGTLLNRKSLAEMFTEQKTTDGKPTGYGLGWHVFSIDGRKWVGHSGGQPGVSTFLLLDPEQGFAVSLMANLEGVSLTPLAVRIAEIALR